MQNKLITYSIGIPAYNEENNIGNLLADILKQNKQKGFVLQNIYVFSDKSNDNTEAIISKLSKRSSKIKLIVNRRRMGKLNSLNKLFKTCNSDTLILFDADVRLKTNTIKYLLKKINIKFYLVAGNPVPVKDNNKNIASLASYFSWLILSEIKKIQPESIYSAHGRILALSKQLYKQIDFKKLTTPGDDQYIYLVNKMNKGNFVYEKNAIVYFKNPSTVKDYLKQSIRFRKAKMFKKIMFRKTNFDMKDILYIKNQFMIILKLLIKYPLNCMSWIALYFIGFLNFNLGLIKNEKYQKYWEVSTSSK